MIKSIQQKKNPVLKTNFVFAECFDYFPSSHEMNPSSNYQIHFTCNLQKLQNANSPLKSSLPL